MAARVSRLLHPARPLPAAASVAICLAAALLVTATPRCSSCKRLRAGSGLVG